MGLYFLSNVRVSEERESNGQPSYVYTSSGKAVPTYGYRVVQGGKDGQLYDIQNGVARPINGGSIEKMAAYSEAAEPEIGFSLDRHVSGKSHALIAKYLGMSTGEVLSAEAQFMGKFVCAAVTEYGASIESTVNPLRYSASALLKNIGVEANNLATISVVMANLVQRGSLPAAEAVILNKIYANGMTQQELAELLDMSEEEVAEQYASAMKHMADIVGSVTAANTETAETAG